MLNLTEDKSRRDFMKDGMRAVLLGGIVFSGLFLGWRGRANSNDKVPCSLDLPCRTCSKINRCTKAEAQQEQNRIAENRSSK